VPENAEFDLMIHNDFQLMFKHFANKKGKAIPFYFVFTINSVWTYPFITEGMAIPFYLVFTITRVWPYPFI
jgi:hypothetical protein